MAGTILIRAGQVVAVEDLDRGNHPHALSLMEGTRTDALTLTAAPAMMLSTWIAAPLCERER